MDSSLGNSADAPLAPALIDGPSMAVPAEPVPGDLDSTSGEPVDTEFWDACWTLEDEWIPRAVVRPEPRQRHHRGKQLPEVFALL